MLLDEEDKMGDKVFEDKIKEYEKLPFETSKNIIKSKKFTNEEIDSLAEEYRNILKKEYFKIFNKYN